MGLLKTKEYIDLVDLALLAHEEYDYPPIGDKNSFHHQFSEAMDYPGQEETVWIEIPDDDKWDEVLEDYGEKYAKILNFFKKLIEDGHLPEDRAEYEILVWW